jgi:DNA-binding NtrC family response regulator
MADLSHVLVVDDSPRMVGLLARWLRRAGFQAAGVTTIQEALDFLGKQVTDWVITDVMLPTGDGMDILAYARAKQPLAQVIVMTAFGSKAAGRGAMDLGAYGFLRKPFNSQALLTFLARETLSGENL